MGESLRARLLGGRRAKRGATVPTPPDELMVRVGVSPTYLTTPALRADEFDRRGRDSYADICSSLPPDWQWDGKHVLDFGCGCGRVLRRFLPHIADGACLHGCDIHEPSIRWMKANYPPGIHLFENTEEPPLHGMADASVDLIYCGSVFSHLTEWAPWLIEMRRILRPGGVLVASLHGRGFWDLGVAGSRGVPWDEDRTGILVEHYGSGFYDGWGPAVYVSEWWLRAHWGRAFEIVRYEPAGFAVPENRATGQAWVVARKPHGNEAITLDLLRSPSEDSRELAAALRGQWLAYEELAARG